MEELNTQVVKEKKPRSIIGWLICGLVTSFLQYWFFQLMLDGWTDSDLVILIMNVLILIFALVSAISFAKIIYIKNVKIGSYNIGLKLLFTIILTVFLLLMMYNILFIF